MSTIRIDKEYAKAILQVLENHVKMGFSIVSKETTKDMNKEQKERLQEIFEKYHNVNCGPFNRALKEIIEGKR